MKAADGLCRTRSAEWPKPRVVFRSNGGTAGRAGGSIRQIRVSGGLGPVSGSVPGQRSGTRGSPSQPPGQDRGRPVVGPTINSMSCRVSRPRCCACLRDGWDTGATGQRDAGTVGHLGQPQARRLAQTKRPPGFRARRAHRSSPENTTNRPHASTGGDHFPGRT